jgi:hypothetical protein
MPLATWEFRLFTAGHQCPFDWGRFVTNTSILREMRSLAGE